MYKLTYPTAYVVDRTQVESDPNWTRHPNGTGPYELDDFPAPDLFDPPRPFPDAGTGEG